MELSLSNVINISVSQPGLGAGYYNTSNLALFTRETPGGGFGSNGYKLYLSPTEVGVDFGTGSDTYKMANAVFSQQPNILANRGYLAVIPFLLNETLVDAIARTEGLVQYFGIMSAEIQSQTDMLDAAAAIQAAMKIGFFVSKTAGDVDVGGMLDLLRSGTLQQSRGLLYVGAGSTTDALVYMAAYAGRGLSTNFDGSNTTQTMHLKNLVNVQPDSAMTQTLLNKAQAAGVDVYCSLEGVPKLFTSGKNGFFDDVYNLSWFVGALKVDGFNVLAQVSTKIPQTEAGMDMLKGAYRKVCERASNNQFVAPGSWTSPVTFGVQSDLFDNIAQRGYYIYSTPISQQSPVARANREAPLCQIAIKYAGAMHSSSVIVNVNQ